MNEGFQNEFATLAFFNYTMRKKTQNNNFIASPTFLCCAQHTQQQHTKKEDRRKKKLVAWLYIYMVWLCMHLSILLFVYVYNIHHVVQIPNRLEWNRHKTGSVNRFKLLRFAPKRMFIQSSSTSITQRNETRDETHTKKRLPKNIFIISANLLSLLCCICVSRC